MWLIIDCAVVLYFSCCQEAKKPAFHPGSYTGQYFYQKDLYFCIGADRNSWLPLCIYVSSYTNSIPFFLDVYSSYAGVKSIINSILGIGKTIKTTKLWGQKSKTFTCNRTDRITFMQTSKIYPTAAFKFDFAESHLCNDRLNGKSSPVIFTTQSDLWLSFG